MGRRLRGPHHRPPRDRAPARAPPRPAGVAPLPRAPDLRGADGGPLAPVPGLGAAARAVRVRALSGAPLRTGLARARRPPAGVAAHPARPPRPVPDPLRGRQDPALLRGRAVARTVLLPPPDQEAPPDVPARLLGRLGGEIGRAHV